MSLSTIPCLELSFCQVGFLLSLRSYFVSIALSCCSVFFPLIFSRSEQKSSRPVSQTSRYHLCCRSCARNSPHSLARAAGSLTYDSALIQRTARAALQYSERTGVAFLKPSTVDFLIAFSDGQVIPPPQKRSLGESLADPVPDLYRFWIHGRFAQPQRGTLGNSDQGRDKLIYKPSIN